MSDWDAQRYRNYTSNSSQDASEAWFLPVGRWLNGSGFKERKLRNQMKKAMPESNAKMAADGWSVLTEFVTPSHVEIVYVKYNSDGGVDQMESREWWADA